MEQIGVYISELKEYLKEIIDSSFYLFLKKFSPFSQDIKDNLDYLLTNIIHGHCDLLGYIGIKSNCKIFGFNYTEDLRNNKIINKFNDYIINLQQESNSLEKYFFIYLFNKIDKIISDFIYEVENSIDFKEHFQCLKLSDKIISDIQKIEKDFKNVRINENTINVFLLGKTGVGKSTLINGFLNKEVAPIEKTTKIEKFSNKQVHELSKFNLFDSKGLTLGDKIEQKIQEINSQCFTDEFFHCIWYCTNVPRFDDNEKELLMKLKKKYSKKKFIPIIFVKTQSLNKDEIEELKKYIEEIDDEKSFSENPLIPVISKEYIINNEDDEEEEEIIIKTKGLKRLREKTIEMAKKTNIINYIREIKKKIDKNVKEDFIYKMMNDLEYQIYCIENKTCYSMINYGYKINFDLNIYDYLKNFFETLVNYKENEEKIIEDNKKRIAKFIEIYKQNFDFNKNSKFSQIKNYFEENKNNYLNEFLENEYENKINELRGRMKNKKMDNKICNESYFKNTVCKRVLDFINDYKDMLFKLRIVRRILAEPIKKYLYLYYDEFSHIIDKCEALENDSDI